MQSGSKARQCANLGGRGTGPPEFAITPPRILIVWYSMFMVQLNGR